MKKTFTSSKKAEVALTALKGDQIIPQIGNSYQVYPTRIGLLKNPR